jgi:hypothetical protein
MPVVQVTASYSAQVTDYYIGVNGTNVTVTLPLGSTTYAGKTFVVKDESGQGATPAGHITIAPTSPNLIDGQSSLTMVVNYLALTILWTGSTWSIV